MAVLKNNLRAFADALDAQERYGERVDEPEGARFLQMSDTMAKAIAAELRDVDRERLEWLSGRVWTPQGAQQPLAAPEGAGDASDVPSDPPSASPEPPGDPVVTDVPPKAEVLAARRAMAQQRQQPGLPVNSVPKGTIKRFKNSDY